MLPDDDDGGEITCYCNKPFSNRPMIECTNCLRWIHLKCAGFKRHQKPPTGDWHCIHCRGGVLPLNLLGIDGEEQDKPKAKAKSASKRSSGGSSRRSKGKSRRSGVTPSKGDSGSSSGESPKSSLNLGGSNRRKKQAPSKLPSSPSTQEEPSGIVKQDQPVPISQAECSGGGDGDTGLEATAETAMDVSL